LLHRGCFSRERVLHFSFSALRILRRSPLLKGAPLCKSTHPSPYKTLSDSNAHHCLPPKST
jgi:hypothetical protein